MAKADLEKNNITKITKPDGTRFNLPVMFPKSKLTHRQISALSVATEFFATNTKSLSSIFSENGEDVKDLLGNPNYKPMVNALWYASVPRYELSHIINQIIENSPHSPGIETGRVIADKFVKTVYSDAKRFEGEAQAKKSATLSIKK